MINNVSISKKRNKSIYFLHTKFKHRFTLNNCLFGSVKLTKNADPVKYKYSGYGIGVDSRSEFLFTDGSMGRNVITFVADMELIIKIKIS